MSEPKYGVVAVGNALVDALAKVDEDFITTHEMEKGAMQLLFDEAKAVELYGQMNEPVQESGGSAANTMAGFASFGGRGGFIGKVADDVVGKAFSESIRGLGLEYTTQPLIVGAPTGRCMIFITPDGQRTMNTFLGASVEFGPDDVDTDLITQAQVTYLEGYLFDKEEAKKAFIKAAEAAHRAGHRIALTLSDPFCVDRHRSDFLRLVEHHVDILFANEEEIKALFLQDNFEDAKSAISEHVEIAVLTRGEKGAVVLHKGEEISVPAVPTTVVDTTGAGDQFAAGFLYGFTQGMSMEQAAKLGAAAAAQVISHVGARPQTPFSALKEKAA